MINRKIMKYALWGAASGLLFAGEAMAERIRHCNGHITAYEYQIHGGENGELGRKAVEKEDSLIRTMWSVGRHGGRLPNTARSRARERFKNCLSTWIKGTKSIDSIADCNNHTVTHKSNARDFHYYVKSLRAKGLNLKEMAASNICKEGVYNGEGLVKARITYNITGDTKCRQRAETISQDIGTNYNICLDHGKGEFRIDTDNDGIPDGFDSDDDNDGTNDDKDPWPKDPDLGGNGGGNTATQADLNRKIIRCYADIAYEAYNPNDIGPGSSFCNTSSKRDNRLGQSKWVFLDHPEEIEFSGHGCLEGIAARPCDTYDLLLKAYHRKNDQAVELLFAFQGLDWIGDNIKGDTDKGHNFLNERYLFRQPRQLRDRWNKIASNDFNLDVSGPHKDRMGIRNIEVNGLVDFLHEVWPFINEHVSAADSSKGSKSLIIRTTGHDAGGTLAELAAITLANRFRERGDVWVEGFSFNPFASFRKSDQASFEDDMGRCHYQHHAFHASNDSVVRWITAQYRELNYIDKGGYYNSDFEINYSDSSKPESACGYTPHYTRSGGRHDMQHWVNSSINAISDDDALSLFSSTIPGEAVSASSASAIAPF